MINFPLLNSSQQHQSYNNYVMYSTYNECCVFNIQLVFFIFFFLTFIIIYCFKLMFHLNSCLKIWKQQTFIIFLSFYYNFITWRFKYTYNNRWINIHKNTLA